MDHREAERVREDVDITDARSRVKRLHRNHRSETPLILIYQNCQTIWLNRSGIIEFCQ